VILKTAHRPFQERHFVGAEAGDKDIAVLALQGSDNGSDLFGFFAFAKNYFGKALAHTPMVVYLCETQVLKGQVAQA
jgi:hypothetical protein